MKTKTFFRIALFCSVCFLVTNLTSCTPNSDDPDDGDDPITGTTVKDVCGNVYHTVTIGTQTWMVENLVTTKFRNGEDIPSYSYVVSTWNGLRTSGMLLNEGNVAGQANRFYNGYAVKDPRNIAPTGWHVPTVQDWETLISYLGGNSYAGGALKDTSATSNWYLNTGATNSTGFTAIPYGFINVNGHNGYTQHASFWSSTDGYSADDLYYYDVFYNGPGTYKSVYYKFFGLSVRCVKD